MVNPIVHRNLREIERTDAVKARNIDAKLVRVRTPLMMGIDSADRTEIVLRCPSVELVERELVGALHHLQTIKRRGDSDCAPRILQKEQSHLRAVDNPSDNFTRNLTLRQ